MRYGEPILSSSKGEDIARLADSGLLQVRVCTGNTALDAVPTEVVETAHKLLGPLSPAEVPIIRCIGLNYKTHSEIPRTVELN